MSSRGSIARSPPRLSQVRRISSSLAKAISPRTPTKTSKGSAGRRSSLSPLTGPAAQQHSDSEENDAFKSRGWHAQRHDDALPVAAEQPAAPPRRLSGLLGLATHHAPQSVGHPVTGTEELERLPPTSPQLSHSDSSPPPNILTPDAAAASAASSAHAHSAASPYYQLDPLASAGLPSHAPSDSLPSTPLTAAVLAGKRSAARPRTNSTHSLPSSSHAVSPGQKQRNMRALFPSKTPQVTAHRTRTRARSRRKFRSRSRSASRSRSRSSSQSRSRSRSRRQHALSDDVLAKHAAHTGLAQSRSPRTGDLQEVIIDAGQRRQQQRRSRVSFSDSPASSVDDDKAAGVMNGHDRARAAHKKLSSSDDLEDVEEGEEQDAAGENSGLNPQHHGPKDVKGGTVTIGGRAGYVSRRVFHVVGFTFLPFFYYVLLPAIYDGIGVRDIDRVDRMVLSFVILLHLLFEPIRIKYGRVSFGMRPWEAHQPSTQFWSGIATLFVFAYAPPDSVLDVQAIPGLHMQNLVNRGIFGAPIVWSLVIDALLGEMRRTKWQVKSQILIGMFAVFVIWFLAALLLGTPWWYILFMPPITVAAEYPDLRIIDDNAMMLMIPYFAVELIDTYGGRTHGAALYDAVHSTPRY